MHVAHWGTLVATKGVSAAKATIDINVEVENSDVNSTKTVTAQTNIYPLNNDNAVATIGPRKITLAPVPGRHSWALWS